MDPEKQLGQKIRELRKERRMSQTELAEKADVALMTISRLERGKHDPHMRTLWRIARSLGVPLLELIRSAGYSENEEDAGMEE